MKERSLPLTLMVYRKLFQPQPTRLLWRVFYVQCKTIKRKDKKTLNGKGWIHYGKT